MNKCLFLDFDGPLYPDRYIRYHAKNNESYPGRVEMPDMMNYWVMDPLAVEMLNFLHDLHPFQTVVSSSWRKFISREQCEDLFFTNGLKLNLADDWKTIIAEQRFRNYDCTRATEIRAYLDTHEVEDYLILDDSASAYSVRKLIDDKSDYLNLSRVVLVNEDLGIGSHDYHKMYDVVREWAGIPKPISFNLW
jgi:hypothetical protein